LALDINYKDVLDEESCFEGSFAEIFKAHTNAMLEFDNYDTRLVVI